MQRQGVVTGLAIPMQDLLRLSRVNKCTRWRRERGKVRPDLIQDFRMFVATPLRSLDMFLRHNGAGGAMETRAVDQTRLKSLKLLTRDDVIVNINNHVQSFRCRLASSLSDSRPSLSSRSLARLNSFVIIGFRGGRSIRLKNAEVIKAKPKIANDRP